MDEISTINRQMNESSGPAASSGSQGIPLEVWAGLE